MQAEKRENFSKRAAKGLLWWLAGELVCFLFTMCMLPLIRKFMILKIFTALSGMLIVNGLYFNFTYNCAVRDRNLTRYHGALSDEKMPFKIALAVPFPQYAMWILLLLSKAGIIGDFFRYYILANIQCLAWVDLFTESREISSLTWGGLTGLLLLVLVSPAVIIVTYRCVFMDIDVKALVMYGKKNK